jgi:DNA recombination protein RmuC
VNVLALVFAAGLVAVVVVVLLSRQNRHASDPASEAVLKALTDLSALKTHVETVTGQQAALGQSLQALQSSVQGVESRVLESSASVRDALGKDLSEARLVVERLKLDAEERRRIEDDVQASARRIETVLLGSRTRGAAGENILQDAFR